MVISLIFAYLKSCNLTLVAELRQITLRTCLNFHLWLLGSSWCRCFHCCNYRLRRCKLLYFNFWLLWSESCRKFRSRSRAWYHQFLDTRVSCINWTEALVLGSIKRFILGRSASSSSMTGSLECAFSMLIISTRSKALATSMAELYRGPTTSTLAP